jgi:DNA-binding HxlR family transcriptional regulator
MPPHSRPRPHPDHHRPAPPNPLADALTQVGDRWSLLVIDDLLAGPRRFGELLDDIAGLAPNILSRRLKQLEADGVVVAEPYNRRPLRHTYRLTAAGDELAGVLRLLARWAAAREGSARGGPAAVGLAHETCGTALEAQWWCPTCAVPVDDDHTTDLHWV